MMNRESSAPPVADASFQSSAAYWEHRLRTMDGIEGVGSIPHGRDFNEWMYKVRKHVFLRRVSELKINYADARVLDIGSGTGFWLDVWKSLGVENLTGSDLTTIAVERLRGRFPTHRMLTLDITAADARAVAKDQFDVISAFDVLFHIVSDAAFHSALANISALLKPGGLFLFSENLPHREMARAQTQVNRSLERVTGELSSAGLRILQRGPMFVLMNAPVDASWRHAMLAWKVFMKPVALYPALGKLYGAALFPLESFLVDRVKEGPSTEFVVCQKV